MMRVMYESEVVEAEVREDGVYVFDEAVCDYVCIGSVEDCESEFAELN